MTYELTLLSGEILRTRVSHPPDRTDYGPRLWAHILRDQLTVTEDEFWTCVRGGIKPARGTPREATSGMLPAELVHLLVNRAGVSEVEVAAMTKEQAVARLNQYWTAQS